MDVFLRDRVRGTTERISVDHAGGDANGDSTGAYISGNGTYVAFTSAASDLVRGDTNGAVDAFVRDRLRKTTRRIPLTAGERGPRGATSVTNHVTAIDASGRHVAIRSAARMVPGDTNGLADLFVVDLVSGAVERVNVSSAGTQANGPTFRGSLSANGRYVAFRSFASNLVARDTNGTLDVFVHDRRTGRTERVSVTSRGRQVTGVMQRPFLSGSGRYVVFRSTARLVHGDTNGLADVFVHDRTTSATIRVSVSNAGRQARGPVFRPAISGSGRVIAFSALASNLVPKDTNDVADVFVHVLRRRR